jgi:hypothetical protein
MSAFGRSMLLGVKMSPVRRTISLILALALLIGGLSSLGYLLFAMTLDRAHQRVLVAFRQPAELGIFSSADGSFIASVPTCGDVDDLFLDSKRDRIYVSCGEGFVDVLAADGNSYRQVAHIATTLGARTSLFIPESDRFLLAVPAKDEAVAAIWIFRPSP